MVQEFLSQNNFLVDGVLLKIVLKAKLDNVVVKYTMLMFIDCLNRENTTNILQPEKMKKEETVK